MLPSNWESTKSRILKTGENFFLSDISMGKSGAELLLALAPVRSIKHFLFAEKQYHLHCIGRPATHVVFNKVSSSNMCHLCKADVNLVKECLSVSK